MPTYVQNLPVTVLLALCSFYALVWIGFRLINWADTEPPRVHEVPGLCRCTVDPMGGVYGHCGHKRLSPVDAYVYIPRHAAVI